MIIDSIDKNIKSIVRINEKDIASGTVLFYGIGLVVTKDGQISADKKVIVPGNVYTATMSDGKEFNLQLVSTDKQTSSVLFKANLPEKTTYTFSPAVFSDVEPKLGQTLIALGGDTTNAVSIGRVVSLSMRDSTVGSTTTKYLASIETDLSSKDLVNGSPIFNLSGDIIGFKSGSDTTRFFTPIAFLKKDILSLTD
jgi:S1-C subfamily serine protease